ncbi:hypothetical protein BGZ80_001922, partial [Entomortierella chlamydospora]
MINDNSSECNEDSSISTYDLDHGHHRNYQELISLLDDLDNSILDLERIREGLYQVSTNIFAP